MTDEFLRKAKVDDRLTLEERMKQLIAMYPWITGVDWDDVERIVEHAAQQIEDDETRTKYRGINSRVHKLGSNGRGEEVSVMVRAAQTNKEMKLNTMRQVGKKTIDRFNSALLHEVLFQRPRKFRT